MTPNEFAEGLRQAADLIETNEIEPEDIAYISDSGNQIVIELVDQAALSRHAGLDASIQLLPVGAGELSPCA